MEERRHRHGRWIISTPLCPDREHNDEVYDPVETRTTHLVFRPCQQQLAAMRSTSPSSISSKLVDPDGAGRLISGRGRSLTSGGCRLVYWAPGERDGGVLSPSAARRMSMLATDALLSSLTCSDDASFPRLCYVSVSNVRKYPTTQPKEVPVDLSDLLQCR